MVNITMDEKDWIERARRAKSLGKLEDAITAYREALAANPRNRPVMEEMGDIYYELGRHAEALSMYDAALAGSPEPPGPL